MDPIGMAFFIIILWYYLTLITLIFLNRLIVDAVLRDIMTQSSRNVPVSEETLTVPKTDSVTKPLFRPKAEDVWKSLTTFKCSPMTPVVFNEPAPPETTTLLAITGKSSTYLTHLDFLVAITKPKNLGLPMVPLISNPPTIPKSVIVVPADNLVNPIPSTALAIPTIPTTLNIPETKTVSFTENVFDSVV